MKAPRHFTKYTLTWLWYQYTPSATLEQMHAAYPHWWPPPCLVTDPGPLDAREP